MEYVCGRNPVREALRGRRRVRRVLAGRSAFQERAAQSILQTAAEKGIAVQETDAQELARLSGILPHQGLVAEVADFPYVSLRELIEGCSDVEQPVVFLLDGITDPMNFGALARSAVAFGISGLIIPKARSVVVTATVARASAGAIEHCLVCQWNLSQAARELKQAGFWLSATAAGAGESIWSADLSGKTAVVLGAEDQGVSAQLRKECDFEIGIPISGSVESLNVAAAGAVIMAETAQRRRE